ncbi:hypothetical protein CLOM_g9877 [Closterium sp. NIES-68]|nr:hypothetical protein CLOM_g9877 [Closterium sp. NIES-68]GJP75930.1 hypothetical protein CLOP_g6328 [Closterium sp. NIES-67]
MAFLEARRSFDRALASDTWTDPAIVASAVRRQLGLSDTVDAAAATSAGREGATASAVGNGTRGHIENAAEMLEQVAEGIGNGDATNGDISDGGGAGAEDVEVVGWPLRSQTVQTAYHNSPDGGANGSGSATAAAADPPPTDPLPPSATAPEGAADIAAPAAVIASAAAVTASAAAATAAAAAAPDGVGPQLMHEQYSGLAEGTVLEKVVTARLQDTMGMLEGLRSAAGSSFEDMAMHREESRAHPEAFGHRDWRLKEQSKSHRVMYRPGSEGVAFHELCLEGVLKGSMDTMLAVAWEAPFFIDWWPRFSVPPFHMLESKFAKRIVPGYELVYLRFKVPWPLATRDILYVLFSVHDAATGFIATSLLSFPEDPAAFDPDAYGFTSDSVPPVRSGEVRVGVKGGFAAKDLGNGCCYFRGVATVDVKLDLVPSWLINFASRQLAGSGYQLIHNEIESVAEGSNKEAEKFRKLLASDPFYLAVGRATREREAAAAAEGERAKQEREQLQQQGEAETFRQIGERVEAEVERLVAGMPAGTGRAAGSESEGGGAAAGDEAVMNAAEALAGATAAPVAGSESEGDGAAGGEAVMNAAQALVEAAAAPVPAVPVAATPGPSKPASAMAVAKPPRPPSPARLAAAVTAPPLGAAAVGAAAGSPAVQYGQLQQRDPAIFHAVTTLDRAISFMRARAAAQRQAAAAAGGGGAGTGAAGFPGLMPPKQEVWSYSGELRPAPRQGESGGGGDAGGIGGSGEGETEERVWMLTRTISAGPAGHGSSERIGIETARSAGQSVTVSASTVAAAAAVAATSKDGTAASGGIAAQPDAAVAAQEEDVAVLPAGAATPPHSAGEVLGTVEKPEGAGESNDVPAPATGAAEVREGAERPSTAPIGWKDGRDEARRATEGGGDAGSEGSKKQDGKKGWRKRLLGLKLSRAPQ